MSKQIGYIMDISIASLDETSLVKVLQAVHGVTTTAIVGFNVKGQPAERVKGVMSFNRRMTHTLFTVNYSEDEPSPEDLTYEVGANPDEGDNPLDSVDISATEAEDDSEENDAKDSDEDESNEEASHD